MTDVGPLMIAARNAGHAEYIVRSRAEQRGVRLTNIEVTDAHGDMWVVNVEVDDAADLAAAASLAEDTTVLHFDRHRPHS
jgi:uncharacterized protein with GYD domain